MLKKHLYRKITKNTVLSPVPPLTPEEQLITLFGFFAYHKEAEINLTENGK